jgi:protein TonB
MALRCLLFSSDESTAESICQVLADLGVAGEVCSDPAAAIEKIATQPFQIIIIDWDMQASAGSVLTTARERKASERPLTLAIVSDDASVPIALQAGANSILRKPILVNQVKDTLTTARDLLRAKQESAATMAQASAAGAAATASTSAPLPRPASLESEKTLRAGEFLQSPTSAPGGQFETESVLPDQSPREIDALQELEPIASAVAEAPSAPPPPPVADEPRGLEWYLKTRGGAVRPSPVPLPPPPKPDKPELLGFDQSPSFAPPAQAKSEIAPPAPSPQPAGQQSQSDHHEEEKLFAHIAGEGESQESEKDEPKPSSGLGKRAIVAALLLAACAVVAAPQAPWHPQVRILWAHGQRVLHAWLNPQPVTTPQAPESHESFNRAGDEYKMPVTENIPDATTDPSQIQVVPVVDPTAKKPNNAGANTDQPAPQPDGAIPGDQPAPTPSVQTQPAQVQDSKPTQPTPVAVQPDAASATTAPPVSAPPAVDASHPIPTFAAPPTLAPAQPTAKTPQPRTVSAPVHVPSSLQSQMASMTPDSSGNKPPENALPSIEPVVVPEAAERGLLVDQPAIAYPPSAKSQQGTVVLQVLIARDGAVQDAMFLQGSLAFARAAIDGVKQWKFKPYLMNGRAASVQTTMTMNFKPGS